MDTIAMVVGYVVMVLAAVVTILYGFEWHTEIDSSTTNVPVVEWKFFKFYGFGYLWVPLQNSILLENLRKIRKDEKAGFSFKTGVLFILTPEWFNKYVYNAGTR